MSFKTTLFCVTYFFLIKKMNLIIIKNWVMETIISLYFTKKNLIYVVLKIFFKKIKLKFLEL